MPAVFWLLSEGIKKGTGRKMIHPSYVDLMQVVNKGVEEGETPVINSRYSIVMATAKRARQIVDGDDPMIHVSEGEKPLSIAVEELNQEKIHILAENAPDEEEEISEYEEITYGEDETEEVEGEEVIE
jgi:DNA-directed RNA polymerase subunit omega